MRHNQSAMSSAGHENASSCDGPKAPTFIMQKQSTR
jgi:hypothetical protein